MCIIFINYHSNQIQQQTFIIRWFIRNLTSVKQHAISTTLAIRAYEETNTDYKRVETRRNQSEQLNLEI